MAAHFICSALTSLPHTIMASETQGAQVPSAVTPVKTLVLDAGPLLSLTPLRNVATKYLTTPAVLAELRDVNAREHWERLKLLQDIDVEVREPDAVSMSKGAQLRLYGSSQARSLLVQSWHGQSIPEISRSCREPIWALLRSRTRQKSR